MTIRRAEIKDIPGINNLLAQVLLVHHKGRPDLFKEIGQKYTDEELQELIRKTQDPIFVYEDGRKILGQCLSNYYLTIPQFQMKLLNFI